MQHSEVQTQPESSTTFKISHPIYTMLYWVSRSAFGRCVSSIISSKWLTSITHSSQHLRRLHSAIKQADWVLERICLDQSQLENFGKFHNIEVLCKIILIRDLNNTVWHSNRRSTFYNTADPFGYLSASFPVADMFGAGGGIWGGLGEFLNLLSNIPRFLCLKRYCYYLKIYFFPWGSSYQFLVVMWHDFISAIQSWTRSQVWLRKSDMFSTGKFIFQCPLHIFVAWIPKWKVWATIPIYL